MYFLTTYLSLNACKLLLFYVCSRYFPSQKIGQAAGQKLCHSLINMEKNVLRAVVYYFDGKYKRK